LVVVVTTVMMMTTVMVTTDKTIITIRLHSSCHRRHHCHQSLKFKFYRQWPTSAGFLFLLGYLLNLFPRFSKDSGHNLGDDCQILAG
jgi:hypothetical protein